MRSPLQSKRSLLSRSKQKGAVAVVLGLSLVTLFAMGGVVLDLGHLYIAKSELQNAADAAALAGAKELNETAAGVTSALSKASAIALKNNYNFATAISLDSTSSSDDIQFASHPDGPWYTAAALPAPPTGIGFVKVDTGTKSLDTYLMRVAGNAFNTISTSGIAVAGRFVNNVTPIGVCGMVIPGTTTLRPKGEVLANNELAQFGFRRGVSYNVFNLGDLGSDSDPYLINPVDKYPNPCTPSNSNATNTAYAVCNGSSAVLSATTGTVYGNTGVSAGKIEDSLNSRFNVFGGASACIPAQAPPDTNIKKYACTGAGCNTPAANWMAPSRQTLNLQRTVSQNDFGVMWSYSRAVKAVGATPNATPGTEFALSDWSTLYPTAPPPVANTNYPSGDTPYFSTSAGHFEAPTVNAGLTERRVLNLAIANCGAVTGSGGCKAIPIVGIGRFFMQTSAVFRGNPKKLEVEFAGLISPTPKSEIKLYR
jgi:Flp pilus assembly protein TadG